MVTTLTDTTAICMHPLVRIEAQQAFYYVTRIENPEKSYPLKGEIKQGGVRNLDDLVHVRATSSKRTHIVTDHHGKLLLRYLSIVYADKSCGTT